MTKHIGILLFDDVEELDAVGPWEVLAYWVNAFDGDGYSVSTVSRTGTPVRCGHGMVITPDCGFADAPQWEVLIHPGGKGAQARALDPEHLDWVRAQRERVPLMASVCTGALVYAAAGLLKGRPATTHWRALDRLSQLDPTVQPRPDERFVDDGDILTSAGVSAGIDMTLHLVGRLAGTERAQRIRHAIQYDPMPPA